MMVGGGEYKKLKAMEVHLQTIIDLMGRANDVAKETIKVEKEVEKQIEKNRNVFHRAADRIENFMSKGEGATVFFRRLLYAAGGYKIINKFNVSLRATGKVFETLNKIRPKGFMKIFANKKEQSDVGGFSNLFDMADSGTLNENSTIVKPQRIRDKIGGGIKGGITKAQGFVSFFRDSKKRTKFFNKIKGKTIQFLGNSLKFIKGGLKFLLLASFYIAIIAVALQAFKPQLGKAWDAAKDGFSTAWGFIKKGGKLFKDGFSQIWSFLKDPFGKGKLEGMMDGILKIGLGLLTVLWGIITGIILPIWKFVIIFIKSSIARLVKKITNMGKKGIVYSIFGLIGLIVIAIYGLPLILTAAIILGAWFLIKKLKNMFSGKGFFGKHAGGGIVNSNMQLVGEGGPELVSLPRGSRVHTNTQSKKMVSKGGGNTFNITVNANSLADNDLRKVAQKVGQMVNREVNRSTSSRTVM